MICTNVEKAYNILNADGWFGEDVSRYTRMMDIVLKLTNAISTENDKAEFESNITEAFVLLLGLCKFFDIDMTTISTTKIEEGWVKNLTFKEFCYHLIGKLTDTSFKREQKVLIGMNLLDTYCRQNNIDIDHLLDERLKEEVDLDEWLG